MKTTEKKKKSSVEIIGSLIIGGTTMIGLGVGFFLFRISIFAFLGSLMTGIGLGLVIAPIVSRKSLEKELAEN